MSALAMSMPFTLPDASLTLAALQAGTGSFLSTLEVGQTAQGGVSCFPSCLEGFCRQPDTERMVSQVNAAVSTGLQQGPF